ncbi:hypothetical protein H0H92_001018 [Tricholoma furcatifolium]|nr:hypothetical protein H0H92_001018 [Tricholoma furcatifolium]
MSNIPDAPAPWKLTCRSWIFLVSALSSTSSLPAGFADPNEAEALASGGIFVGTPGSILWFFKDDELLYVPGRWKYNDGSSGYLTPEAVADFQITTTSDGETTIKVSHPDANEPFFHVATKRVPLLSHIPIPFNTRLFGKYSCLIQPPLPQGEQAEQIATTDWRSVIPTFSGTAHLECIIPRMDGKVGDGKGFPAVLPWSVGVYSSKMICEFPDPGGLDVGSMYLAMHDKHPPAKLESSPGPWYQPRAPMESVAAPAYDPLFTWQLCNNLLQTPIDRPWKLKGRQWVFPVSRLPSTSAFPEGFASSIEAESLSSGGEFIGGLGAIMVNLWSWAITIRSAEILHDQMTSFSTFLENGSIKTVVLDPASPLNFDISESLADFSINTSDTVTTIKVTLPGATEPFFHVQIKPVSFLSLVSMPLTLIFGKSTPFVQPPLPAGKQPEEVATNGQWASFSFFVKGSAHVERIVPQMQGGKVGDGKSFPAIVPKTLGLYAPHASFDVPAAVFVDSV